MTDHPETLYLEQARAGGIKTTLHAPGQWSATHGRVTGEGATALEAVSLVCCAKKWPTYERWCEIREYRLRIAARERMKSTD